jgi:hypothetical protein
MGQRSNRRRRFGVAQDIELERRLLSIERELAKLVPSEQNFDSKNRRMYTGKRPPQVGGVTVQKSPGTLTVQWTKLDATNISHYEVQVSESPAYTSPKIARVQENFYTFQDSPGVAVLPLVTYYVRVRAVINSSAGPWSAAASSALGLVTTNNILPGAVSLLSEEEITTFDPTALTVSGVPPATGNVTYGSAQIPALGGVVFPRVIMEMDVTTAGSTTIYSRLTTQFIRNPGNVIVGTYANDVQSTVSGARITLGGFSEFDAPGTGGFTYSVKITIASQSGDSTMTITPQRLRRWEHR